MLLGVESGGETPLLDVGASVSPIAWSGEGAFD